MNWDSVIHKVSPYLVKIETPGGSGTGFLCTYNANHDLCGIATAMHVIDDAEEWQHPIRVKNYNNALFLRETDRVVFKNRANDSAVLLIRPLNLGLPQDLIPLRPIEAPLSIGAEVGWLGFPWLEPETLCFFSGNISARRPDRSAYLVDGVAINGVSGGPLLYSSQSDGVQFVGVVSAYRANRQRGESLPGLLVAQDVSHFHQVIQHIKSMDEAAKRRAEMEMPHDSSEAAGHTSWVRSRDCSGEL